MKKMTLTLALAVLAPATLLAHPPDVGTLETLVSFNPQALETPESLVGEVRDDLHKPRSDRRDSQDCANRPATTLITLPIGPPLTVCGPFFAGVTGIASIPRTARCTPPWRPATSPSAASGESRRTAMVS